MVNLDGEVIGINTAISSSSGGSDGVGFAVPINLANWVANQLIDHGSVQRAFLGVGIQPITQKLADYFNVPPKQGLLVTHVLPQSPAAQAGVRTGDILLEFAGARVSAPNEFQTHVERAVVGHSYNLVINRNGTRQNLNCVPQSQPNPPSEDTGKMMNTSHSNRTSSGRLGVRVGDFDAAVAQKMGIDATQGVVILAIEPGSHAHRAGLVPGMILAQVNHNEIESLSQFNQLMSEMDLEESLLFLTKSQNGARFVVLES
jgi:serine protease Do